MLEIPVYMITGFLESGKTSFLQDVLSGEDFADGRSNLLILCEEGETEYDPQVLKDGNVTVVTVEDEEDFHPEFLKKCVREYKPHRVFLEMNGMWDIKWMFEEGLPANLEIAQVITLVDGSTFSVYLNNMRSILSNLFQYTEMVMFNRCTQDMDLHAFRRSVRGVNPGAMIYFEDVNQNPIDPGMEQPPYDLNADVIEIEDMDYGLWFLDATDNPERYDGKKVRFLAKVMRPKGFPEDTFIPGRNAMTCCEDDIRFIGYLCKAPGAKLKSRDWVWITATIRYEYVKDYGEEGPVLYAEEWTKAEAPKEDLVYFN
ncbi:MAG: GTP-binding protein [Eubacteriales bacterium]|nr:GTP-binding protein [Eubacteriales bacterium]